MAQLSKKKKILFILIAVAIGFIIALISAEILIRIVSPQNLSGSWRQYHESGLILNKDSGESRHQQGERTVTYNFTDFHTRNSRIISGTKKVLVLGDSFTFG
ncbi:MAG: hypothetical protein NE328_23530, partial [Lentisphaeraceae bacterium]|nr:hypothetical protein [Lentisphaeraceae bacterium]